MRFDHVAPPAQDGPTRPADAPAAPAGVGQLAPRRSRLVPWLSALGLASLCFLLGAAVMFFEWPPSGFLGRAFLGSRAWNERRQMASSPDEAPAPAPVVEVDEPGKTFDGFTLYTCNADPVSGTQAYLINMRREPVHKWAAPFSRVWPDPPHLRVQVPDSMVYVFGCHLYPNGDLLVVFHGLEQLANGYGLAKLDKDSNVLWKYAARCHHDVDVGEDGTVYAIAHENVNVMPPGLEHLPTPSLVDYLVMLSPEGKELRKPIPILEALRDSPYSALLSSIGKPAKRQSAPGLNVRQFLDTLRSQDVLHTNSVKVLTRELAPKFPGFKAGQVLISMRNLDAVAVLDPDTGSVVWAARGPWLSQHDAQFLDNGRMLIFDNLGSPQTSRVLEYDPRTQAFPWAYPAGDGAPFFTRERGMCQRLPNGNTLIVNSEGGQILEVSPGHELVWSCSVNRYLSTGRRYAAGELQFLKGDQRARP